jgi:hypothetical protein
MNNKVNAPIEDVSIDIRVKFKCNTHQRESILRQFPSTLSSCRRHTPHIACVNSTSLSYQLLNETRIPLESMKSNVIYTVSYSFSHHAVKTTIKSFVCVGGHPSGPLQSPLPYLYPIPYIVIVLSPSCYKDPGCENVDRVALKNSAQTRSDVKKDLGRNVTNHELVVRCLTKELDVSFGGNQRFSLHRKKLEEGMLGS